MDKYVKQLIHRSNARSVQQREKQTARDSAWRKCLGDLGGEYSTNPAMGCLLSSEPVNGVLVRRTEKVGIVLASTVDSCQRVHLPMK